MGRYVQFGCLLVLISFISGCCMNVKCDCNFQTAKIMYENANGECLYFTSSDFLIKEINVQSSDTLITTGQALTPVCNYWFDPTLAATKWIFQSDSLSISDTLQVASIGYAKGPKKGCCRCGDPIGSMTVILNGTFMDTSAEVNIIR